MFEVGSTRNLLGVTELEALAVVWESSISIPTCMAIVRFVFATLLSYSSLTEWSPQVPHKKDNRNLALLYLHSSKSLLIQNSIPN